MSWLESLRFFVKDYSSIALTFLMEFASLTLPFSRSGSRRDSGQAGMTRKLKKVISYRNPKYWGCATHSPLLRGELPISSYYKERWELTIRLTSLQFVIPACPESFFVFLMEKH